MKILMKIHTQKMMQIHQMKALTRIWLAFILVLIISFCVHLQPLDLKKQKTRDCMICTVSWSFDRRFLLNLKPFRQQKKISMGYDVFCNRWDELFFMTINCTVKCSLWLMKSASYVQNKAKGMRNLLNLRHG